jgi:hypothetical protein
MRAAIKRIMVDALLHTNARSFIDALGHQVQVLYPDSTSDSSGFDALERRVAATNQAGVVTRFGYDALSTADGGDECFRRGAAGRHPVCVR